MGETQEGANALRNFVGDEVEYSPFEPISVDPKAWGEHVRLSGLGFDDGFGGTGRGNGPEEGRPAKIRRENNWDSGLE